MDFGKLIGQVLQQGMNPRSQARVNHSLGDAGLGGLLGQVLGAGGSQAAGGGALGQILGSVLGGQSGAARSGGADLGSILGSMLGAGGSAGAGGLGELLGSVLGGGSQAGRGSSATSSGSPGMAILATLAMAALKNWQGGGAKGGMGLMSASVESSFDVEEFSRLTSAELEELMLRAMISAAKADGEIDEAELQRIVGRMAEDGLSAEEKQFLINELQRPLDLAGLIAAVPNPAVAAQVYAASLLAIELDNDAEYAYLRQLAQGLGLDPATVSRLHQLTGVKV